MKFDAAVVEIWRNGSSKLVLLMRELDDNTHRETLPKML